MRARGEEISYIQHCRAVQVSFFIGSSVAHRQHDLRVFEEHCAKCAYPHPEYRAEAAKSYRCRNSDDISHAKSSRKRESERPKGRYAVRARRLFELIYNFTKLAYMKKTEIKAVKNTDRNKQHGNARTKDVFVDKPEHKNTLLLKKKAENKLIEKTNVK
jgi:hypothetical protein